MTECRTAQHAYCAAGRHTRRHLAWCCTRWLDDARIVLVMLHAMRSARSCERRSQPAAAGASSKLIARPTIVQLRHAHLPSRALSSLVLRDARTGDRDTACCAACDKHSRWPHSWRASHPILARCTSDRRCARCRCADGAHSRLPPVMQDELQSDALDAALEETKAQVESVAARIPKWAECAR